MSTLLMNAHSLRTTLITAHSGSLSSSPGSGPCGRATICKLQVRRTGSQGGALYAELRRSRMQTAPVVREKAALNKIITSLIIEVNWYTFTHHVMHLAILGRHLTGLNGAINLIKINITRRMAINFTGLVACWRQPYPNSDYNNGGRLMP